MVDLDGESGWWWFVFEICLVSETPIIYLFYYKCLMLLIESLPESAAAAYVEGRY